MPRMKSADIGSGAVLAALGSYVVVQSLQWEYLGPDGPGPGFFPFWYGAAMIGLSLGLVAAAVMRTGVAEPGRPANWSEIGRALGAWAAFALSAALLQLLGFLSSLALLTVFIVRVMYGRPLTEAIGAGVLGAIAFYVIFPLALEVPLPRGIVGF